MTSYRAGFSEIDITPPIGGSRQVPYLPAASIRGVQWPLRGRVALFEDGERRAAIVALDLISLLPETASRLRSELAAVGELSADEVFISCTHTHNGPKTKFGFGEPPDLQYLELLESKLPEAMAAAAARLEPVELRYGRSVTHGLTFNRRPVYADGQVGTHGPMWVEDFVRLEGQADEELQVLVAQRQDGSIAGGLVGWACHPHILLPEPLYSADFVGAMAEKLAERHGGTFLYLQGASGNLSWGDMSAESEQFESETGEVVTQLTVAQANVVSEMGEAITQRRLAQANQWADALVEAVEAAYAASRAVESGRIRAASRTVEIEQRTATLEQVELAFWFLAQEPGSVDLDEFNRKMTGRRYTFYGNRGLQNLFAREAIGMWEWHQRSGLQPPLQPVEISALAIADVAFVAYPAEMFTEFGLRTKAESPFPSTFVCGLANGWVGYVPTVEAFERGGYETRLGYSSRLVPDAGDTMTAVALELLHDLVTRP